MKKMFSALWVLVCFSGVYFSRGVLASSGTGDSTTSIPVKAETFTGKVDSVAELDSGEGKIQQMTIRGDDGRQTTFVIAPDATIMDKDGNPMSLSWVKGNRVSIKCVTASNGYTRTIKSMQKL